MKKIITFLILLSSSVFAFELSIEKARELIFNEVYKIHRCDEPAYYTKSVCEGEFLEAVSFNSKLNAFEVTFEYEKGQMLNATVFEDESVDVSYWSE